MEQSGSSVNRVKLLVSIANLEKRPKKWRAEFYWIESPTGETHFTVLSRQGAEGNKFPANTLPVVHPLSLRNSWVQCQCLHPCVLVRSFLCSENLGLCDKNLIFMHTNFQRNSRTLLPFQRENPVPMWVCRQVSFREWNMILIQWVCPSLSESAHYFFITVGVENDQIWVLWEWIK